MAKDAAEPNPFEDRGSNPFGENSGAPSSQRQPGDTISQKPNGGDASHTNTNLDKERDKHSRGELGRRVLNSLYHTYRNHFIAKIASLKKEGKSKDEVINNFKMFIVKAKDKDELYVVFAYKEGDKYKILDAYRTPYKLDKGEVGSTTNFAPRGFKARQSEGSVWYVDLKRKDILSILPVPVGVGVGRHQYKIVAEIDNRNSAFRSAVQHIYETDSIEPEQIDTTKDKNVRKAGGYIHMFLRPALHKVLGLSVPSTTSTTRRPASDRGERRTAPQPASIGQTIRDDFTSGRIKIQRRSLWDYIAKTGDDDVINKKKGIAVSYSIFTVGDEDKYIVKFSWKDKNSKNRLVAYKYEKGRYTLLTTDPSKYKYNVRERSITVNRQEYKNVARASTGIVSVAGLIGTSATPRGPRGGSGARQNTNVGVDPLLHNRRAKQMSKALKEEGKLNTLSFRPSLPNAAIKGLNYIKTHKEYKTLRRVVSSIWGQDINEIKMGDLKASFNRLMGETIPKQGSITLTFADEQTYENVWKWLKITLGGNAIFNEGGQKALGATRGLVVKGLHQLSPDSGPNNQYNITISWHNYDDLAKLFEIFDARLGYYMGSLLFLGMLQQATSQNVTPSLNNQPLDNQLASPTQDDDVYYFVTTNTGTPDGEINGIYRVWITRDGETHYQQWNNGQWSEVRDANWFNKEKLQIINFKYMYIPGEGSSKYFLIGINLGNNNQKKGPQGICFDDGGQIFVTTNDGPQQSGLTTSISTIDDITSRQLSLNSFLSMKGIEKYYDMFFEGMRGIKRLKFLNISQQPQIGNVKYRQNAVGPLYFDGTNDGQRVKKAKGFKLTSVLGTSVLGSEGRIYPIKEKQKGGGTPDPSPQGTPSSSPQIDYFLGVIKAEDREGNPHQYLSLVFNDDTNLTTTTAINQYAFGANNQKAIPLFKWNGKRRFFIMSESGDGIIAIKKEQSIIPFHFQSGSINGNNKIIINFTMKDIDNHTVGDYDAFLVAAEPYDNSPPKEIYPDNTENDNGSINVNGRGVQVTAVYAVVFDRKLGKVSEVRKVKNLAVEWTDNGPKFYQYDTQQQKWQEVQGNLTINIAKKGWKGFDNLAKDEAVLKIGG